MKSLKVGESAGGFFEIPGEIMERLIVFVEESNEPFFLAMLKIVSYFCFQKLLSREKINPSCFEFPSGEINESLLPRLAWSSILNLGPIKKDTSDIIKIFLTSSDNASLFSNPKRIAELDIISGERSLTDLMEKPEVFIKEAAKKYHADKENFQQVLRELSIFRIIFKEEVMLQKEISDEFYRLWDKIRYKVYGFLNEIIKAVKNEEEENKKTSLSLLLLIIYELRIIFSSEIIFSPEFCVD